MLLLLREQILPDELDGRGQHVEDPSGRGHGPLVEVKRFSEARQLQQALGHEHQHGVGTNGHCAFEREPPTEKQRCRETDEDGHSDEGVKAVESRIASRLASRYAH